MALARGYAMACHRLALVYLSVQRHLSACTVKLNSRAFDLNFVH